MYRNILPATSDNSLKMGLLIVLTEYFKTLIVGAIAYYLC